MTANDLRMRKAECGICDTTFTDDRVVDMARSIAQHWNDDHSDELAVSETAFKREEYGGRHLHGDEYAYTVKEYYITVYDVLDDCGGSCGPFAYAYVKKPEAVDVCEDCWRSIKTVDGYREIDDSDWRTKYRCDECHRERRIERQKDENQQITEFAQ
ncbi:hypothetical protein [Haloarcula sp. JP-L23]|uniref:hypothetical protein n=1 Tax=Haloarcula sp. JP-L23 TaxID=2716717 RepID=UPI00140EFF07|nr:hypothetical protein G9465_24715 [Haloarcula sp. JP-L23]